MGSGGGGGGGGGYEQSTSGSAGGCGGGGAGAKSGGCIKLYSNVFNLGASGHIKSNNYLTGNGGVGCDTTANASGGGGGGVAPNAGGTGGNHTGDGTNVGTSHGGNSYYYTGYYGTGVPGQGGAVDQDGTAGIYDSPSGYAPGNGGGGGGSGSGGGILIKFERRLAQITALQKFVISGSVNNAGGLGVANGGTVKLYAPTRNSIVAPTTGRDYRVSTGPFGAMAG